MINFLTQRCLFNFITTSRVVSQGEDTGLFQIIKRNRRQFAGTGKSGYLIFQNMVA